MPGIARKTEPCRESRTVARELFHSSRRIAESSVKLRLDIISNRFCL
ncbi:hypothetical protein [Sphingomonas sp. MS122]